MERLDLPPAAEEVARQTAAMYLGFPVPWVGYFAIEDETVVGTCSFKSPPVEGRVEIAYFTFPGHEGIGIATAMARSLIAIARHEHVNVFAQTLPESTASSAILEKLGFHNRRMIEHPEDGPVWEWELSEPGHA